jgi:hypothetical protein
MLYAKNSAWDVRFVQEKMHHGALRRYCSMIVSIPNEKKKKKKKQKKPRVLAEAQKLISKLYQLNVWQCYWTPYRTAENRKYCSRASCNSREHSYLVAESVTPFSKSDE